MGRPFRRRGRIARSACRRAVRGVGEARRRHRGGVGRGGPRGAPLQRGRPLFPRRARRAQPRRLRSRGPGVRHRGGKGTRAPAGWAAHMRRALSFLTVLGRADVPNARTLSWFPVVGAAVGALVGGAWWAAGRLWPPAVAALVAVAVDAGLTGCLHLDGLADSADGLIPPVTRERRFEIMADPRVGAFGAVALVVVLGLREIGRAH